jgi:hypothetical protein
VVDDHVEQLVHADEVRAAHVPVRLLAVQGERLQAEHDRGGGTGCAAGDGRVDGRCGDGLGVAHDVSSVIVRIRAC